jgi:hypothetical protein
MRGFIALTSAIIISAMLLVVVVGGSLTGIYARYDMLDAELKERSAALADACADTVRLRIAGDSTYAGAQMVPVGDEHCRIFASSDAAANPRPFVVQGIYRRSYTTIAFAVDTATLGVSGRKELPSYP